jgi:hypothetical protein
MFYSILFALDLPSRFQNCLVTPEAIQCNQVPTFLKAVQYFVFPTFNLAVPILPQCNFVLKPTLPHGASAVVDSASVHEVYLCSLYLKSAVVGGNNNKNKLSIPHHNLLAPQITDLQNKQMQRFKNV